MPRAPRNLDPALNCGSASCMSATLVNVVSGYETKLIYHYLYSRALHLQTDVIGMLDGYENIDCNVVSKVRTSNNYG